MAISHLSVNNSIQQFIFQTFYGEIHEELKVYGTEEPINWSQLELLLWLALVLAPFSNNLTPL